MLWKLTDYKLSPLSRGLLYQKAWAEWKRLTHRIPNYEMSKITFIRRWLNNFQYNADSQFEVATGVSRSKRDDKAAAAAVTLEIPHMRISQCFPFISSSTLTCMHLILLSLEMRQNIWKHLFNQGLQGRNKDLYFNTYYILHTFYLKNLNLPPYYLRALKIRLSCMIYIYTCMIDWSILAQSMSRKWLLS